MYPVENQTKLHLNKGTRHNEHALVKGYQIHQHTIIQLSCVVYITEICTVKPCLSGRRSYGHLGQPGRLFKTFERNFKITAAVRVLRAHSPLGELRITATRK